MLTVKNSRVRKITDLVIFNVMLFFKLSWKVDMNGFFHLRDRSYLIGPRMFISLSAKPLSTLFFLPLEFIKLWFLKL